MFVCGVILFCSCDKGFKPSISSLCTIKNETEHDIYIYNANLTKKTNFSAEIEKSSNFELFFERIGVDSYIVWDVGSEMNVFFDGEKRLKYVRKDDGEYGDIKHPFSYDYVMKESVRHKDGGGADQFVFTITDNDYENAELIQPDSKYKVKRKKRFSFEIISNREAGFEWQIKDKNDLEITQFIDVVYKKLGKPDNDDCSGVETWTFKATNIGTGEIVLKYVNTEDDNVIIEEKSILVEIYE